MKNDILKPVILFGYCHICMGGIVMTMHLFSLRNDSHATSFTSFAVAVSFFHWVRSYIKKEMGVLLFQILPVLIVRWIPHRHVYWSKNVKIHR